MLDGQAIDFGLLRSLRLFLQGTSQCITLFTNPSARLRQRGNSAGSALLVSHLGQMLKRWRWSGFVDPAIDSLFLASRILSYPRGEIDHFSGMTIDQEGRMKIFTLMASSMLVASSVLVVAPALTNPAKSATPITEVAFDPALGQLPESIAADVQGNL